MFQCTAMSIDVSSDVSELQKRENLERESSGKQLLGGSQREHSYYTSR